MKKTYYESKWSQEIFRIEDDTDIVYSCEFEVDHHGYGMLTSVSRREDRTGTKFVEIEFPTAELRGYLEGKSEAPVANEDGEEDFTNMEKISHHYHESLRDERDGGKT